MKKNLTGNKGGQEVVSGDKGRSICAVTEL